MTTLRDLFGNEALTFAQFLQRLQDAPQALRDLAGAANRNAPQGAAGNGAVPGSAPQDVFSAQSGAKPAPAGPDAFSRGLQSAVEPQKKPDAASAANGQNPPVAPGNYTTNDAANAQYPQNYPQNARQPQGAAQPAQNPQALAQLQAAYNDLQARYQADLDQVRLDSAVDTALTAAQARNPVAVRALLDMSGIRMVNGQVQGLAEQIALLRQREPYLFQQSASQDTGDTYAVTTGGRHGAQGGAPLDKFLTAAMAAAGI